MDVQLVALCTAGGAALAGGAMLLSFAFGRRARFVYTGAFIAWCLFALAIVLVLFSLFPGSSVTGTFEGLKVGGAIGGFLVVVAWLARQGRMVIDKDRQVDRFEKKIEDLEQQLKLAPKVESQRAAPLSGATRYRYRTVTRPRRTVGLIAGNLAEVRDVDVWVNSENTNMQMASYFDRSISAVIRYYGSRRSRSGDVEADLIGDQLREEVGGAQTVAPGTVYVTPPGSLAGWGVKRIIHVAAVQGEAGHGYRPVRNLAGCVSEVLEKMDAESRQSGEPLRSVVFPLLGTGQARGNPADIFPVLIKAVLTYLENRPTQVTEVWFVVYAEPDLALCQRVLGGEPGLDASSETRASTRS
jgi:O-acetyl-ADP-ribose deacetylase (regulator of RNase III)